jgi:hypothetical protein
MPIFRKEGLYMAVFRVEKTRDYTVMANHHLRNTALSLKAKGLLSLMLSLPDGWDYTTRGLARICKDGVDSICSTVKELEEHGYVVRRRVRNDKGQLAEVEYTISEQPSPKRENPVLDNPILAEPVLGEPEQENPAQLNTNISNTYSSSIDTSNPIQSNPKKPQAADGMGTEARSLYREIILENIDYDILLHDQKYCHDRLDEIVELLLETVCSARQTIRVAGDDFPADVVKSRLLKLNSEHIQYVLNCMSDNTTYVRNIKKYLLAALFNAPSTIGNYYSALVNHDLYGGGKRR